jgi:hypothetical protein
MLCPNFPNGCLFFVKHEKAIKNASSRNNVTKCIEGYVNVFSVDFIVYEILML